MLNVEVGEEVDETISPARFAINNLLLNNQQAFLVGQHAYLRGKTRATFPLTPGVQFYPIWSPINGTPLNRLLDLDRPETMEFVNYSNFRYRLKFGISQDDYNVYNSIYGVAGVPCMKWDLVNNQAAIADPAANYTASTITYTGLTVGAQYQWIPGPQEVSFTYNGATITAQDIFTVVAGVTTATATGAATTAPFTGQLNTIGLMIEVWPIPSVPQSLELAGALPLTRMENDTDTCVIDDLLIVLFCAAEILARSSQGDAQAKITKAQAHLNSLKASYPTSHETFNISGGRRFIPGYHTGTGQPVIAVNGN